MKSKKYGFNPTEYKIFNVLPCSGKFVMDEQYVYLITSIVVAAEIKSTFEGTVYHPIEHIYLADAFADDAEECATRAYNPDEVHSIFTETELYWMLKDIWDKGEWDNYYTPRQIHETISLLDANSVAISKEVREFISEPITIDRVCEYHPDRERWSKEETNKTSDK